LTLLEVVISMAIFLISLVAIFQLSSFGADRAMDVKIQSRASMLCQSKLAEVMVGAEQLTTTGYASYPNEKDIQWKMDASEGDVKGLWNVKIWVRTELPTGRIVEAHLCRMVLDPSIRGSTMDSPTTPAP